MLKHVHHCMALPRDTNTLLTVSGRLLRCEVFVDKVVRIEILTTTRTMYKDEVETLQIQAYDSEGKNSFFFQ